MLEVRRSNRLEHLADALVERLREPASGRVLDADLVVVQSPGMATWLRHRAAERLGIAAAVEFPLPSTFLWRVVRALCEDVPSRSPYDKAALRWPLFGLLAPGGALLADRRCQRLARYLVDDETGLKRFQLAERVADVLDAYLVYRPDWIAAWDDGDDLPAITASEPWQPLLWRALREALARTRGDAAVREDRATLTRQATQRLASEDCRARLAAAGLPPRIAVFGISAMPPPQLELLLALSAQLDVVIHAFDPCREYWGDLVSERRLLALEAEERVREETAPTHPYHETGHPLLAELGAGGRAFVDTVLDLGPEAELVDDFLAPDDASALATLQRDVLELRGAEAPVAVRDADESLAFVECHGPLRELEVLHDWLLARFEADPELVPRDVVVMIPDIDRYAPYVDAVFGGGAAGGQAGATRIPHSISDRGLAAQTPVLAALRTLLGLPRSRFALSEVLGLLETPAVLRACGLDAGDLEALDVVLDRAGVRWGRDDAHWAEAGIPRAEEGERANTWRFGADRMLLGYAMGDAMGERAATVLERVPLAGVEGSTAEAVGRLLDFVDRLALHAERLRGPHGAQAWQRNIEALLADCVDEGTEETLALAPLREALADLVDRAAQAGLSEPFSRDLLLAVLEPALEARESGHRFLGGGVTFCTLLPMRTIPFRVVALLGMNDADYPRRDVPLDFDLLVRDRRRGDRSRREEDRFLFLEAVLAARDHLYVSWSGRSPVDDTEQPPSVVVSTLLDVVERRFLDAGERLRRVHPLQPFSARYDGESLRTASTLWSLPEAAELPSPVAPTAVAFPEPEAEPALGLSRLIAFYVDPPGALLDTVLSVRFSPDDAALDDDEPFEFDGLVRHGVRDGALDVLRSGGDARGFLERTRASGVLPQGHAGRAALLHTRALIEDYRTRLGEALISDCVGTLPVALTLTGPTPGATVLEGVVAGCGERAQLRLRAGKASARDRVRAWIESLALAAAGSPRHALLVDSEAIRHYAPPDADTARSTLEMLVALRAELLQRPAPLLCASALAHAERLAKGKDAVDALTHARRAFEGSDFGPPGEGARPAARRLWPEFPGDVSAQRDAFAELALQVYAPLLEAEGSEKQIRAAPLAHLLPVEGDEVLDA